MKIEFVNNKPYIEEVCLDEIVKSNKTPFYLYSQNSIQETYKKLSKSLSSEIFYAVKANSNQAILMLMKNFGAGADVVSIGELKRVLAVGFHPNKIIFEGVGKSEDDLLYAVNNNIRLINAESINEIININKIGKELQKKIHIGLRINPDIDANTLEKISTGKKSDKFGINISKLSETLSLINTLDNINLKGISCHIGSQINNLKIFEKVFKTMKKTADFVLSQNISLEYVDLGGGFGVNYENDREDLDITGISKLVHSIFKDSKYKISFEPGRYLIAKSSIIVTKILNTKENGDVNFLITDAGMQTLIRPAMYNALHRVQVLSNLNNKEKKYTIAGPICETSDTLVKDIMLPEQNVNNYLAIKDTGAYGAVMSSNYNSRGIPSEILINKKKYFIIHKEESIEEIINRDSIPDWL